MENKPQGLKKEERLSLQKSVEALFEPGHQSFSAFPLRAVFLSTEESGVRILVSVSKRHFKRAVRRNLLKRRMRESYRTQKDLLGQAGPLDLLLVYNSKEILDYQVIRQDVAAVLQHIAHQKEETV